MWLRAVARTRPGCCGVGRQTASRRKRWRCGVRHGRIPPDRTGQDRTGQDGTGRAAVGVESCRWAGGGVLGVLRWARTTACDVACEASGRLEGQRRRRPVGRVGVVFVLWRMIGYCTQRQLSHGRLADAGMETAKLLMRCGEAENVASDSACLAAAAAAAPWHHLLCLVYASSATTPPAYRAYSLAHLPLQPSSSGLPQSPRSPHCMAFCFCCAIVGVAACNDGAAMTQN